MFEGMRQRPSSFTRSNYQTTDNDVAVPNPAESQQVMSVRPTLSEATGRDGATAMGYENIPTRSDWTLAPDDQSRRRALVADLKQHEASTRVDFAYADDYHPKAVSSQEEASFTQNKRLQRVTAKGDTVREHTQLSRDRAATTNSRDYRHTSAVETPGHDSFHAVEALCSLCSSRASESLSPSLPKSCSEHLAKLQQQFCNVQVELNDTRNEMNAFREAFDRMRTILGGFGLNFSMYDSYEGKKSQSEVLNDAQANASVEPVNGVRTETDTKKLTPPHHTPTDFYPALARPQEFLENESTTISHDHHTTADDLENIDELTERAKKRKKLAMSVRNKRPLFVQKLRRLVDGKDNNSLIRWSRSGKSFCILDEAKFAETALPDYFKSSAFTSFQRQLNSYGFSKNAMFQDNPILIDQQDNKTSEWSHPYFHRDYPILAWLCEKQKKKRPPKEGEKEEHEQRISF
ncbi:hypothetical protein FSARC_5061 [Fusarium sarcochroum]|uniref:HSF-type DNA-binding domain-containing protein n=1 Tax=Fusarium sarcochroum TaxID=1208366 RepID=A0A8H4X9X5_9HYPO|nr:hypothetical protein FSARC_5061 [Fusarium sarcochroum]